MIKNNVADVIETFTSFMMPRLDNIDQFETSGRVNLAEKMLPYVRENKPLEFVMLGLPFKSTNDRDKVFGKIPDFGEELMMQNFSRFNREIKKIYEPGVSISVASDGLIFNELLGVPENVVYQYKESTTENNLLQQLKTVPGKSKEEIKDSASLVFGAWLNDIEKKLDDIEMADRTKFSVETRVITCEEYSSTHQVRKCVIEYSHIERQ